MDPRTGVEAVGCTSCTMLNAIMTIKEPKCEGSKSDITHLYVVERSW